jgi:hypothetical protein
VNRGVSESHPARPLDCHRASLRRFRPQHAAFVGLDEVALDILDAVVALLDLRRHRDRIIALRRYREHGSEAGRYGE